jgi:XTP/dITP diphosphohydrolase
VPPALVVTVSPRLPGLLNPAGWRALASGRPLAALPGAAATAAALRAEGWTDT